MGTELNVKIIREFLSDLIEKDLYEPLRDLLIAKGYRVWITHGGHEFGKDIVATNDKHNIILSAKRGNIDQVKWKEDVDSSLRDLMQTPINHSEIDESLPRRPILVFNGVMTTYLYQKLKFFNEYYEKRGDPLLEAWDISRLAEEFNAHFFATDLLGNTYLEDIHRLILSIKENSIDTSLSCLFVDTHLDINNKYPAFKLAFIYVLRRSENMKNSYAFFYFSEYSMIQIWYKMYTSGDFSNLVKFTQLHEIYVEHLWKWVKSLEPLLYKRAGLLDKLHGGLAEIFAYPLRTFDTIRRISYLSYFYLQTGKQDKANEIGKLLVSLLDNNESASKPMRESQYTDIGLALMVMKLLNLEAYAREWIYKILEFLISLYNSGNQIMPLTGDTSNLFKLLFNEKESEDSLTFSHLLVLIFDFIWILNAKNLYYYLRPKLNKNIVLKELVMPTENYESEIYEKKYLHSTDVRIGDIPVTWESLGADYKSRKSQWNRKYTPDLYKMPFVLILISGFYKDRYFPSLWRNKF